MVNKVYPALCSNHDCTGCMACVNACHKRAISIEENEEGFYRPFIHQDKCIGCLLCEKVCPIKNPPQRYELNNASVYAGWHNDSTIRQQSSSGGAFSALAEFILSKGGYIAGAAYTEDLHIEHILINKISDLNKLRLSKYAQSRIGNIFEDILEKLKQNQYLLFVGTACQVQGLKKYLRKDYEKLICVDFICHGVPSNLFLQKYVQWLVPKVGPVKHINFRAKDKGWYDNLRVIQNENKKSKSLKGSNDSYWIAFSRNNCLQESCYNCKAQGFPRCSDITLADFWRIGHDIPFGHKNEIENGVSMIVVNNIQKQWIVDGASKYLYTEKRTLSEAISGNKAGLGKTERPSTRDSFYSDLRRMEFDSFRKQYMTPTIKETFVKLFREYIPFWIIKYIRLKKQK